MSAIEYLLEYGWMLLVVAIVGGAVITTVQNDQEEKALTDQFTEEMRQAERLTGMRSCGVVDVEKNRNKIRGNASISVSYDCCQEIGVENDTIEYCQQYKALSDGENFTKHYQITN